MCNFISWIETDEANFYLTKKDLRGRKFAEFKKENNGWKRDIVGHGAIEYFYPNIRGKHRECENFSNPNNFPSDIVNSIKKGEFRGLGICVEILNDKGKEEYNKIEQPALKEYYKITQPALEEYNKIIQSALEEYNKIIQPALEEYNKIQQSAYEEYYKIHQSAWEEYKKIEQPAYEEYKKIQQPAYEEYEKIQQSALEEYNKIQQSAWKEYKKIQQPAFWNIAVQKKYRKNIWK